MNPSLKNLLPVLMMTVCGALSAAEPTEAKAQYDMGNQYFREGKYALAVSCYRKGAENGYLPAQNTMGVFALNGTYGVKKDPQAAVAWFRKAAEKGWSPAQYYLGECYEKGTGVEKDLKQAEYWYRKGAEKKNRGAIKALQRLKQSGR